MTWRVGVEPGFLEHLAHRRGFKAVVDVVLGAGDRLPEAGRIGALDQQHLQAGRVDHHQHRLRHLGRAGGITDCP